MFLRDFTRHTATPVSAAPATTGLTAATLVETDHGWVAAASLTVGRIVQTLDGGAVRIVTLQRQTLPATTALIHLPGGVLDNCSDLLLLPRQMVLLDTLGTLDAPYALTSAASLLTLPGVTLRKSPHAVQVITPGFASEEVLWANSGVLLHCPGRQAQPGFFPHLTAPQAKALLTCRSRLAA
ncbi:MAG: Hint domain-containing protein [Pseudomonadota bacterium]